MSDLHMKRSALLTWFYLLLVFVSGAVVGVFGHRLYEMNTVSANSAPRNQQEWRRHYTEEMQSRLNLTPDQMSKVSEILDDTHRRVHEVHERSKPELAAIQNDQVQRVRSILTDQQKPEYEKWRAERELKRAQAAGKN
jgi:hypothetical protein